MSALTIENLQLLPVGRYNISICFNEGVLEVGHDEKYTSSKTYRFHRGDDSLRIEIENGIATAKKMVCGLMLSFDILSDKIIIIE